MLPFSYQYILSATPTPKSTSNKRYMNTLGHNLAKQPTYPRADIMEMTKCELILL